MAESPPPETALEDPSSDEVPRRLLPGDKLKSKVETFPEPVISSSHEIIRNGNTANTTKYLFEPVGKDNVARSGIGGHRTGRRDRRVHKRLIQRLHIPAPQPKEDRDDHNEDGYKEADEEADENDIDINLEGRSNIFVANHAGFLDHIRRLNPQMDEYEYHWLANRTAVDQETRYKTLLEFRVAHLRKGHSCPNVKLCKTHIDINMPTYKTIRKSTLNSDDYPFGVPMPPILAFPAEFECQVCFKISKCRTPSDWTKHVFEDLRPFTCTFKKCKEPKPFQRKEDWVRHENECHRRLEWWKCDVNDCDHICYKKDNFVHHLLHDHKAWELAPISEARAKNPNIVSTAPYLLVRWHHETTARPQDEPCKFCGKTFDSWESLINHSAKHMQQISLPMLQLVKVANIDGNPLINPIEQISSSSTHNVYQDKDAAFMLFISNLRRRQQSDRLNRDKQNAKSVVESHEPGSQDWDVKSLASLKTYRDSALGSSLPSVMEGSVMQDLPQSGQEEILLILLSDLQLRSLLEETSTRISKLRFVRNIRRLLLSFHIELLKTAGDHREKDAASILGKHTVWFSSRLFDISHLENKSKAQDMNVHLSQQIDKRPMLERFLASKATGSFQTPAPTQLPEDVDGSSSSDVETDASEIEGDIDYSNFPNIGHIKDFMIGGAAFKNLKRGMWNFLNLGQTAAWRQTQIPFETLSHQTDADASTSDSQDSPKAIPKALEESLQEPESAEMTEITIPDIDMDDSEEDLASVSSDDPAINGASDDRVLNPRGYFSKLEDLQRDTFLDCAFLSTGETVTGDFYDERVVLSSEVDFAFHTKIENTAVVSIIKFSASESLLHLLECYNIIRRTGKSLAKLQSAGYCADFITILVMDRGNTRRGIAKAVQVSIQAIFDLGVTFESALRDVVSKVLTLQLGHVNQFSVNAILHANDTAKRLTAKCIDMLIDIGLLPNTRSNEDISILWDCIVQSLQLGVLSYSGAHIQQFDPAMIQSAAMSFQVPIKIAYHDKSLSEMSLRKYDSVVQLRCRQLQCLGKPLGGAKPWVFHGSCDSNLNDRVYLSTTISSLTDLWGPSWKVLDESEPQHVRQFNIGNGAILPWSEGMGSSPNQFVLNPGEVYCHWISPKNWDEELIREHQASLPRKHFLESDLLLIGANDEAGLFVNEDCISSLKRILRIKTKLDDQGALRAPKTFRGKRYVDSKTIQIGGSVLGIVSGSGTITYKRRVGHTMKDVLVERWRHNLGNPMDLEAFSGVEVSFCTQNARRRRLMHLLRSQTLCNYLRAISFKWICEACEHAYLKALRSPKSFRRFWKVHKDWQSNVADAISVCLDALEETGIDEDSGELSALWIESFDVDGDSDSESDSEGDDTSVSRSVPGTSSFYEEHIVKMFRSEYTWAAFLKDSEESLTMATVGMTCLDFIHQNGYGRRCTVQQTTHKDIPKSKGFAVLQTSLKLNESILKKEKLVEDGVDCGDKSSWGANGIKQGTTFSLGNYGTLKVISNSTQNCPVIVEWKPVKSEIVQELKDIGVNEKLLGRSSERHHKEYIGGSWDTKLLSILVMSKSTKVRLSKG